MHFIFRVSFIIALRSISFAGPSHTKGLHCGKNVFLLCKSVISPIPTKYLYILAAGFIVAGWRGESLQTTVHQKRTKHFVSLSVSPNIYKIFPMLQVLNGSSCDNPIGHDRFLLIFIGLNVLFVCALWFRSPLWGICRQGTIFTESFLQDFFHLFKALSLSN